MSGRNRLLRLAPLFVVSALAAVLLTACPPPITPDLANVVQDNNAPVVTITSPANNSAFRSSLTVTGKVTDDSKVAGDGLGVLRSISFEVGGAEWLSRTLIFSDDGYTVDPEDRVFSYNADSGEFSIPFSTADPLLTGFRQITVTAIDERGHESRTQITVYAYTDGPHVEIIAPENGKSYGPTETIFGKVTNRLGTDLTDEVDFDQLTYRVGGKTTQIVNDPALDMTLDTETGEFEVLHRFNPLPTGGIILDVSAKDLAGYEGTASVELVDLALSGLEFTSPGPDTGALGNYYYSSVLTTPGEATVTITGTPLEPERISLIAWDARDASGDWTAQDADISYDPDALPGGQFTFDVDLIDVGEIGASNGKVTITISSYDDKGRLSPYEFWIQDDTTGPSASGTTGAANAYIDVDFGEPVWGDLNRASPVAPGNFVTSAPNGDPAITSVTTTSGSALSGGEEVIRLNLTFTAGQEPDEGQDLTLTPVGGSEPVDAANNRWVGSVVVPLQDQKRPEIDSIAVGAVNGALAGASNQYANAGDTVDFTVTFSEPVFVTGTPILYLDFNGDGSYDSAYASYLNGSGATHTFRYTVNTENTAGAYLDHADGSLGMSGATIRDASGFDLIPTVPASGSIAATERIVVDTTAPVVNPDVLATPATLDSIVVSGGTVVGSYINRTNDTLTANLSGIASGTPTSGLIETNLMEGWIELLIDGGSFTSELSQTIAGDTVVVTLNGTGVNPDAPLEPNVPEGGHTFTARVYDAAGNEGPVVNNSFGRTADYTPPTAPSAITMDGTGSAAVSGYINTYHTGFAASATIVAGEATGGQAQVYRSGLGTPLATDSSIVGTDTSVSFSGGLGSLPDGEYTITVEVQDAAGNVSSADMAGTIIVDTAVPPKPTNVSADADGSSPAGYINANSTWVTVTADIDVSGATDDDQWVAELLRNGLSFPTPVTQTDLSSGTISLTTTPGSPQFPEGGPHTLTVRVTKPSGNTDTSTSSDSMTADYTPPGEPSGISGKGLNNNEVIGYLNDSPNNNLEITVTGATSALGGAAELHVYKSGSPVGSTVTSGTIDGSGSVVFNYLSSGDVGNLQTDFPEDLSNPYVLRVVLTDAAGNVGSESTVFGEVTADYSDDLTYVTMHSLDADHDGVAESVEIEFNEPVRDEFGDATAWQVERVDTAGSPDYFDNFSTAVSSITGGTTSVADDEYITLSINSPAYSSTRQLRIRYGADGVTDLAGNAFGGTGSTWNNVDDMAPAVLIGAVSDPKSTAGLFNDDGDKLTLTFSEPIDDSYFSAWAIPSDLETFFYIADDGHVDPDDGGNFHNGVTVALGGGAAGPTKVELLQSGAGSSTTVFDATADLTTISVVANTSGGHYFRGADGLGVYTSAGTAASFSVAGSPGVRGGAGPVAITGGTSAASSRRVSETRLLPPMDVVGGGVSTTTDLDETPYRAPAVEQMRASIQTAQTQEPVSRTATVGPADAAGAPAASSVRKVPDADAKEELQPADAPRVAAVSAAAVVREAHDSEAGEAGSTAPGESSPAEITQALPAERAAAVTPADRAVPGGSDTDPASAPVFARQGGRGAAAIIALIALMVLVAGAALLVISRLGRDRSGSGRNSGGSRE